MGKQKRKHPGSTEGWPNPPGEGRDVVLHTRVVTDTGGGPDKTILLSAPFLAETNYWLAAAYMHPPDDAGFDEVKSRAKAVGCPLISVPDRGPLDQSVLRQMLAICKRFNVRIWHGHDYKSNLLGLTLRPFWPMKLVTTVHGWVKHTDPHAALLSRRPVVPAVLSPRVVRVGRPRRARGETGRAQGKAHADPQRDRRSYLPPIVPGSRI